MPADKDDKDKELDKVRQAQQFEQNSAWIADNLPLQWRRIYENCMSVGFDAEQSLKLVQTYILSFGSGPKMPPV